MSPKQARETLLSYKRFTLANLGESWDDLKLPRNVVEAMLTLLVGDDGAREALREEFPVTPETPLGT